MSQNILFGGGGGGGGGDQIHYTCICISGITLVLPT